jgi:hypothetical protein
MENFFNYITKNLNHEEVDVWFRVNNIYPEKLELFSDFTHSLNTLIVDTFLGDETESTETKINLSDEDNRKHFEWCWNKVVDNFNKEKIIFEKKGDHYDYFESFFFEIFYNQKEKELRLSIDKFFNDLFNTKTSFTKSDLDMIGTIYKLLDKNMSV